MVEIAERVNQKHKFGQYFTPRNVADFMIGLADIDQFASILEPSCGQGIFLELLQEKGFQYITAYEIDAELALDFPYVYYESFVSAKINQTFDLVIGNPPYIRWKNLEPQLKAELVTQPLWQKYCNALCDYLSIFILKSIELLNDEGQLIFICPEYWMNTTHSEALRNYMMENGYFSAIYHFNETPIFDKVAVSMVIFKFIKSKKRAEQINVIKFQQQKKLTQDILQQLRYAQCVEGADYISVPQFLPYQRWRLQSKDIQEKLYQFERACQKDSDLTPLDLFNEVDCTYNCIGDVCEIGNGMVSGLDKAFQVNVENLNQYEQQSILNVVKAKNLLPYLATKQTDYIFIQDDTLTEHNFKYRYPNFYQHLQPYKLDLNKRYQYNRQIHYWQWAFLRNFNLFSQAGQRIFVPCKERISHKNYFRFALVEEGVFPTQDVTALFRKKETQESIEYITAYLNQSFVFDWLKCNGVIKGNIVEFSEKPLSSIPFRKINWDSAFEVNIHHCITYLVRAYLLNKKASCLTEIADLFQKLLEIK